MNQLPEQKKVENSAASNTISCGEIAKSIHDLMVFANFSGYIRQAEGQSLRQFSMDPVSETRERAELRLKFAGQHFKISVTYEECAEVPYE